MNRVEIDGNRCKACGLCIDVCNRHLLDLSSDLNAKGYHPIAIHDEHECSACALCGVVCPEGSIAVYKEIKAKKGAG
jgi:2-oxoglutarate ferredoxin oxidoreductase subunit delta